MIVGKVMSESALAIVCPNCASSIDTSPVLTAGPFSYSDSNGFRAEGSSLRMSAHTGRLLGFIMAGSGAPINVDALMQTTGGSSANPRKLIQVQLSKAKCRFRAAGVEWPVENAFGQGWFWAGPPVQAIDALSRTDTPDHAAWTFPGDGAGI